MPDGTQCESGFPGLYRLGLIGGGSPTDFHIEQVVNEFTGKPSSESMSALESLRLQTAARTEHSSIRLRELENRYATKHTKEISTFEPNLSDLRETIHSEDHLVSRVNKWGYRGHKVTHRYNNNGIEQRHPHYKISPGLALFIDYHNRHSKREQQPAILDATIENILVVRDASGELNLFAGESGRSEILRWYHTKRNRKVDTPRNPFFLPNHAVRARVVAAQTVCRRKFSGEQQDELLRIHAAAATGELSLVDQISALKLAGFTNRELFGDRSQTSSTMAMPGLYRLGLIGSRVPKETELIVIQKSSDLKTNSCP